MTLALTLFLAGAILPLPSSPVVFRLSFLSCLIQGLKLSDFFPRLEPTF